MYGLEHNDPQEQENRPQLPKKSGLIELTNPDFGFSPFYQRLADNNRVNLEESVEAVMIKQRNHQFGQLSFSFQNLNDNKLKDFKGSMNEILISELRKNAAALLEESKNPDDQLECRNELWVYDGILIHHFDFDKLKEIKEKYTRLGLALTHYYLPSLYQSEIQEDAANNSVDVLIREKLINQLESSD